MVKTLPPSLGGAASIPGRGTKIPYALRYGQKTSSYFWSLEGLVS